MALVNVGVYSLSRALIITYHGPNTGRQKWWFGLSVRCLANFTGNEKKNEAEGKLSLYDDTMPK